MDYTNFVRTYYRTLINRLKQTNNYSGKIVDSFKDFDIPKEFLYVSKGTNSFMPIEEVNINAPIQYIFAYLEYLGRLMPDIADLFANQQILGELYAKFLARNGDNDEQFVGQLEVFIDLFIEIKKQLGVLA